MKKEMQEAVNKAKTKKDKLFFQYDKVEKSIKKLEVDRQKLLCQIYEKYGIKKED